MPKYFAAPGSPFSDEDAEEIGPELERLALAGASSPKDIVAYASANETPLRRHLHMDRPLEQVAEAWYRFRARRVAGSIMVRVRTGDGYRTVRAFHSVTVSVAPKESGGEPVRSRYVTVSQVRDSAAMSEQVVERARRELEAWGERYADYRDVFGPVYSAIEAVRAA